jgi:hypothetical protein
MVTHEIAGSNLILRVEGMDKLWALKSELVIPLRHITDIRMDEEVAKGWWHGLKFPGSNIPGVLTAGTFYQDGKRVFWDVHTPDAAVVISLADEAYNELVIEVEDPGALMREIYRIRKQ